MRFPHGLVLLPVLAFAGCAALNDIDAGEERPAVVEMRGDGADAGRALVFYARVRKLQGPELAHEQEAARRALAGARTDGNRVRYALVLAVPGASAQDEGRALELLEPVLRSSDGALRGLALLVTTFLQEQRRLDGNVQNLQQKLDALLTLERNMTGRESGSVRKR